MIWPFTRRRKPVRDCRVWNEDWRVGDLAVCVSDRFPRTRVTDPVKGELLRVSRIIEGEGDCNEGRVRAYCLMFHGKCPRTAWECTAFRKVRPDATAADTAFTAMVKRMGRKVVSA